MDRLTKISQQFEERVQKRIEREGLFYEKVLDLLSELEASLNSDNSDLGQHKIEVLTLTSKDLRCAEGKSVGVLRNQKSSAFTSANALKFYDGKVRVSPLLKETDDSYFFGFQYSVPTVSLKERLSYDLRIEIPFLFKISQDVNGADNNKGFIVSANHTIDFLMNVGNFTPKMFQSQLEFPSFNEDFKKYVLGFVEGYIKNNSEEVFGLF